jgi:hypothetical protein
MLKAPDPVSDIGLDVAQLRARVVEPALGFLQLPGGEAAIRLVLGSAVHESEGLRYLAQAPSGPALGLWQIEPEAFNDLDDNFLKFRPALSAKLDQLVARWPSPTLQLATNLIFGAAVCRLIYFRAPEPLPDADDIDGMAKLWKLRFNTAAGAGTVAEWVSDYRRYIGGS